MYCARATSRVSPAHRPDREPVGPGRDSGGLPWIPRSYQRQSSLSPTDGSCSTCAVHVREPVAVRVGARARCTASRRGRRGTAGPVLGRRRVDRAPSAARRRRASSDAAAAESHDADDRGVQRRQPRVVARRPADRVRIDTRERAAVWTIDPTAPSREVEGAEIGTDLSVGWTPDGRLVWLSPDGGTTHSDLSTGRQELLVKDASVVGCPIHDSRPTAIACGVVEPQAAPALAAVVAVARSGCWRVRHVSSGWSPDAYGSTRTNRRPNVVKISASTGSRSGGTVPAGH